jgi:hypothetical protein
MAGRTTVARGLEAYFARERSAALAFVIDDNGSRVTPAAMARLHKDYTHLIFVADSIEELGRYHPGLDFGRFIHVGITPPPRIGWLGRFRRWRSKRRMDRQFQQMKRGLTTKL